VLALQSVLQEALNKQQQEEAHLHAYLSEAATTMYHMSPQGRQGGTILDENQQSQAARAQVKQNYTL